jgi:hypothetical protein
MDIAGQHVYLHARRHGIPAIVVLTWRIQWLPDRFLFAELPTSVINPAGCDLVVYVPVADDATLLATCHR